MPEQKAEPTRTPLWILLRNNLLVSALIFAALECWRPYFFLTDDNLDGTFPFLYEMGHHLLAGQSPFISTHLFGGNYNAMRDPASTIWHPLYLVMSLLAGTPFYRALLEGPALFFYLLATAGFVSLAHFLRREMALRISDGWIMFYSLSFTYSMIALTTGASWLQFLGNHSALPWLTLGILQPSWRRGVGIVMLFSLHQLLGGHLAPVVSSSIFLTLFALGLSIGRRSWVPICNWVGGGLAAVIILSPLLLPMVHGFDSSHRSQGLTLVDMQANNIPFNLFPTSLFFGMALWVIDRQPHLTVTYVLALGSCAAAWCLVPAIVSRAKWRGLEVVTGCLLLFMALLICRPIWITEAMMHIPIMRSLRWPFRELLEFQFFLHLFLLVRTPGLNLVARRFSAWFGTAVFVLPMIFYVTAPTFNSMAWDRELVLGDGFDRYWAQVRPLLKPGDRVAVLIPLDYYMDDRFEKPFSLLGTFDYAPLAGIVNASGYSPTAPRDQAYIHTFSVYPFGAYRPEQKAALEAEHPDLKFITLESQYPLKITLSSRDGPTIDLTPLVPPRKAKIIVPVPYLDAINSAPEPAAR